jgi:hypothetical protein
MYYLREEFFSLMNAMMFLLSLFTIHEGISLAVAYVFFFVSPYDTILIIRLTLRITDYNFMYILGTCCIRLSYMQPFKHAIFSATGA